MGDFGLSPSASIFSDVSAYPGTEEVHIPNFRRGDKSKQPELFESKIRIEDDGNVIKRESSENCIRGESKIEKQEFSPQLSTPPRSDQETLQENSLTEEILNPGAFDEFSVISSMRTRSPSPATLFPMLYPVTETPELPELLQSPTWHENELLSSSIIEESELTDSTTLSNESAGIHFRFPGKHYPKTNKQYEHPPSNLATRSNPTKYYESLLPSEHHAREAVAISHNTCDTLGMSNVNSFSEQMTHYYHPQRNQTQANTDRNTSQQFLGPQMTSFYSQQSDVQANQGWQMQHSLDESNWEQNVGFQGRNHWIPMYPMQTNPSYCPPAYQYFTERNSQTAYFPARQIQYPNPNFYSRNRDYFRRQFSIPAMNFSIGPLPGQFQRAPSSNSLQPNSYWAIYQRMKQRAALQNAIQIARFSHVNNPQWNFQH